MSRPFIESMNSSDFERRFSNENKLLYLDETSPEEIAEKYSKLQPYLNRLPKREQDLLYMHFVMKKKQTELGIIFNRTQAAVSYRIKKAIIRLQFLMDVPDVTEEEIQRDLSEIFNQSDIDIMIGMYRHTCQTQVAKDLGSNQCNIRHRFHKNIKILKQQADYVEVYIKYHDLFAKIRDNTNILREVKLSRWDNGDFIVDDQL